MLKEEGTWGDGGHGLGHLPRGQANGGASRVFVKVSLRGDNCFLSGVTPELLFLFPLLQSPGTHVRDCNTIPSKQTFLYGSLLWQNVV